MIQSLYAAANSPPYWFQGIQMNASNGRLYHSVTRLEIAQLMYLLYSVVIVQPE